MDSDDHCGKADSFPSGVALPAFMGEFEKLVDIGFVDEFRAGGFAGFIGLGDIRLPINFMWFGWKYDYWLGTIGL